MSGDIGIGKLIDQERHRDAIHVAVAPAEAGEDLRPGDPVTLVDGRAVMSDRNPVGIVDPFLKLKIIRVEKGSHFYIFLIPGSITSLRHEWEHPAFTAIAPPPAKDPSDSVEVAAAKARIAVYADAVGLSYARTMQAAENWLDGEDYYIFGHNTPSAAYAGAEQFWSDYEIVTGKTVEQSKKQNFFFCAC